MREVFVTGRGMVSAAGFGFPENWRALGRGVSALRVRDDGKVLGQLAPEDEKSLPAAGRRPPDRAVRLAMASAREAIREGRLPAGERLSVFFGTSRGAVTSLEESLDGFLTSGRVPANTSPKTTAGAFASEVARDLGASGPSFTVSSACVSGLSAIGAAFAFLKAGLADHALAGGAESALSPYSLAILKAAGVTARSPSLLYPCRPFHPQREGMVVAEGAACLALTTDPAEPPFARITGYGATVEPGVSPTGLSAEGDGVLSAARKALECAGLEPRDIDLVCVHGAGTRSGDEAELKGLHRLFEVRMPPLACHKWLTGHMLGASSSASAAFATAHMESGLVPRPPYFDEPPPFPVEAQGPIDKVLILALGFGGQSAALIMESTEPPSS